MSNLISLAPTCWAKELNSSASCLLITEAFWLKEAIAAGTGVEANITSAKSLFFSPGSFVFAKAGSSAASGAKSGNGNVTFASLATFCK